MPDSSLPTSPTERHSAGSARPRWFSAKELLGALVLLLLVTPMVEDLKPGKLIVAGLWTLVLLSAPFAVGGRRRTMMVAVALLLPVLVGNWLEEVQPGLLPLWMFPSAFLLFFGFLVVNMFGFVMRAPRVDADVLCAGIAIYLILGLIWGNTYILVARLSPQAFVTNSAYGVASVMDRSTAFYFSFVTLSTVGFGDVTPVSKVARTLTVMEAVVGLFCMGIFIARLVSLYSVSNSQINPTQQHRKAAE